MSKTRIPITDLIAVLRAVKLEQPDDLKDTKKVKSAAFHQRAYERQKLDPTKKISYPTIQANLIRDRSLPLKKPTDSPSDVFDRALFKWIQTGTFPLREHYEREFSAERLTLMPEWLELFSAGLHEPHPDEPTEEELGKEGKKSWRMSREYERDLARRKECLEYFGVRCQACPLDPARRHKHSSLSGLIDVHHRRPLKLGERETSAKKDLIPLCPTCHRVVHRLGGKYLLNPELLRSNWLESATWWK